MDNTIRAQSQTIDTLTAEINLRDENYEALAEMIKNARAETAEAIEISNELVSAQLQSALAEIDMLKGIVAMKDEEIQVHRNCLAQLGQDPPAIGHGIPQGEERLKGRGLFGHRRR